MWERAELKANAKIALTRFYWLAFATCLIYSTIVGFCSVGADLIQLVLQFAEEGLFSFKRSTLVVLVPLFFVGSGVSLALSFLLVNPLGVGICRFFMEGRSFRTDLGVLFYGFTGGRYWKSVRVMGVCTLKILAWSLLFVIPGIIKAYEYCMVSYIYAENPNLETKRIFELSRAMTSGEKGKIFVLDLSFLGWILVGALLCGVGTLFVEPYIHATSAELYALLRAKAFALNLAAPDELCGFAPPVAPVPPVAPCAGA